MSTVLDQIRRDREQLARDIAAHTAKTAAREQRFQSAFVAWLAISFGAALVVMGGCILAGLVAVSVFATKMSVLAILVGLFNVVIGYCRLP